MNCTYGLFKEKEDLKLIKWKFENIIDLNIFKKFENIKNINNNINNIIKSKTFNKDIKNINLKIENFKFDIIKNLDLYNIENLNKYIYIQNIFPKYILNTLKNFKLMIKQSLINTRINNNYKIKRWSSWNYFLKHNNFTDMKQASLYWKSLNKLQKKTYEKLSRSNKKKYNYLLQIHNKARLIKDNIIDIYLIILKKIKIIITNFLNVELKFNIKEKKLSIILSNLINFVKINPRSLIKTNTYWFWKIHLLHIRNVLKLDNGTTKILDTRKYLYGKDELIQNFDLTHIFNSFDEKQKNEIIKQFQKYEKEISNRYYQQFFDNDYSNRYIFDWIKQIFFQKSYTLKSHIYNQTLINIKKKEQEILAINLITAKKLQNQKFLFIKSILINQLNINYNITNIIFDYIINNLSLSNDILVKINVDTPLLINNNSNNNYLNKIIIKIPKYLK